MPQYSLKSQAAYLTISQFLGFALTTIIPIFLVRLMSNKDFGCYRQILFLGSVTVGLMQVSLPQSLYYFYPREKTKRYELLTQTMTLLVISSLIGFIVFNVVTGLFGFAPAEMGRDLLLLASLSFLIESVASVVEHIFILEAQPRRTLLLSGITALGRLITTLGFYLVFRSVAGLVIGLIILHLGRLVFLFGYLRKQYALGAGIPDMSLLREQMRYSLPMVASAIIGVIGTQIDKGVITALMTPEQFAVYSVSSLGILNSITLVCGAIGSVCLPKLSELGGRHDLAGARALWHKMIVMNGLLLIPTICFCMAYAEDILTVLYTHQYAAGANVFRINLLCLVLTMIEFGRIPQAMGETRAVFVSNLARSIVALCLAFMLIPRLGLVGGALSSVAALSVSGVMQIMVSKRRLGLSLAELLPWRQLIYILAISASMTVVLWMLPRNHFSSLLVLPLHGAIFCVLVFVAFVASRIVDMRSVIGFLRSSSSVSG